MRNYIRFLILVAGLWIILTGAAFAANASDGDIFILTDENGISKDAILSEADFSIANLDDSGEYIYYGVDVGIFKKPATGDEWSTLYIQRVETNGLNFKIDDFGKMSGYEYGSIYAVGYRVLYQPIGSTDGSVEETAWRMVPDSYFVVSKQYISSLVHNQVIRYNYNGWKQIEVIGPDQSGLTEPELDAYNRDNFFIDQDLLTYRVHIDVSKTNEITGTKVNLKFNTLSEPSIRLDLKSAALYMEGNPNPIETIDISNAKISENNFLVDLGDALKVNGDGKYYLEYKARIYIGKFNPTFTQIRNTSSFIVYDSDDQGITQLGSSINFKPNVDTKVYKGMVQYH